MNKLTIERNFPATKEKIWNALTNEDLLKQWWSPAGMDCSHMSVDLKEGGQFLYCFKGEDGTEYWGRGKYEKLEAPTSLTYLDTFTDEKGNPVPASHYGIPGDEIIETRVVISLDESDGQTKLTLIGDNPYDEKMTEDMTKGWNGMFDKLETVLKKA